jgi:hypothetical protein
MNIREFRESGLLDQANKALESQGVALEVVTVNPNFHQNIVNVLMAGGVQQGVAQYAAEILFPLNSEELQVNTVSESEEHRDESEQHSDQASSDQDEGSDQTATTKQ